MRTIKLILLLLLGSASLVFAVTHVATDTTTTDAWRSPWVSKADDLGSDDIYGSDGWSFFAYDKPFYESTYLSEWTAQQLPDYISSVGNLSSSWGGGNSEESSHGWIDDPLAIGANIGDDMQARLHFTAGGGSFTINRADPRPFRLTIVGTKNKYQNIDQDITVQAGGTPVTFRMLSINGTPQYVIFDIPFGNDAITVTLDNASADQAGLTALAFDSYVAQNPSPVMISQDVASSATLSWDVSNDPNTPAQPRADVTGYYVYMSKDPAALVQQGGKIVAPATTYVPAIALDKDSLYYWRIDEEISNGGATNAIKGALWAFETEQSLPIIVSQPKGAVIALGEDAVFEVEATDPFGSGLSYGWFYDPNTTISGDEVSLVGLAGYSGAGTSELTVETIDAADLGYYYCEISNAYTVASDAAQLSEAMELYYWPLDGDATEANGSGFDGTVNGNVVWVTGVDGVNQAADFDGNDATFIDCGNALLPTGEISVSAWANTRNAFGAWNGFACKWGDDGRVFWLGEGGGTSQVRFSVYADDFAEIYLDSPMDAAGPLSLNKWVHIVATFDGTVQRLYADGVMVAEAGDRDFAIKDQVGNFVIGQLIGQEGSTFNGVIDEVRVYNYALTREEAAQLYVDIQGGVVCMSGNAFDFNGDCKVDVIDLAAFASNWLECNLFPAINCDN